MAAKTALTTGAAASAVAAIATGTVWTVEVVIHCVLTFFALQNHTHTCTNQERMRVAG